MVAAALMTLTLVVAAQTPAPPADTPPDKAVTTGEARPTEAQPSTTQQPSTVQPTRKPVQPMAKQPVATAMGPGPLIAAGDKLLYDGRDTHRVYKAAISQYEGALKMDALTDAQQAEVHAKISEAWFQRGELAKRDSVKLKHYGQGEKAAARGLKLNDDCVPCIFWRMSNKGRAGQTRGIMRSLFMLPEVKSEYERCLKLDPSYADCILAMAMIDVMVPGIAGGDTERAEKNFKKLLKRAPNHTRAMIDYAVLLEDEGEEQKAIALLKQVIAHKDPLHPGPWRKFDKPRAEKLLKEWD